MGQRATFALSVCIDWVDDGVLEEDGEGGYRLKDEYLEEGSAFRPDLMINNLAEEVRRQGSSGQLERSDAPDGSQWRRSWSKKLIFVCLRCKAALSSLNVSLRSSRYA